jgi:hypothetical protein
MHKYYVLVHFKALSSKGRKRISAFIIETSIEIDYSRYMEASVFGIITIFVFNVLKYIANEHHA